MFTPTLDARQVRAVIKELRGIDQQIVKDLRSDLRSQLAPVATQIAGAVPVDPPLSGFRNNGATGWSPVKGKVGFTPGKSRNNAKNLVAIRVDPVGGKRGLYIAELAGSRSAGSTPSGANLISVLNSRSPMNGRGGRYAYKQFRFLRPDVVKIAERILNATFAKIDRKID
jgi:hypothetical protein